MIKKRHTLIVDDDPTIRDILRAILERDGWSVVTVADGEDAVQQLAADKFDIVVLDLLMPRMNGAQVLDYMAAHGDTTPVVVVSGASSEHRPSLDSRIVRVTMQKPFDTGELRSVLRAIVDAVHDARC